MSITATELKANLGKYLLLAATEDVYITQYGKIVAKLTRACGACGIPLRGPAEDHDAGGGKGGA